MFNFRSKSQVANILIVYYFKTYPLRVNIADHLYSFERYAPHRCYYLNLAVRRLPKYLLNVPFDLIVFHTTFLSQRWGEFDHLVQKARLLKKLKAVKIVLPQDEFFNTDVLCEFINEFGVQLVFSVMPDSEWSKIYTKVDPRKTRFLRVLTGYLENSTLKRIERLSQIIRKRPIDIGYRAWRAAPWLGRHGMLKAQIANVFLENASKSGLVVDISTNDQDTFVGDEWYKFLLRCKYTIGVEGGSSILDRDGSLKEKTEMYLDKHSNASFDEVEAECFPGLDGFANLYAISPRHLEACATRTCQVLIEGEYNGILKPGKHFIELKREFSNLKEILKEIKQNRSSLRITDQAYKDIVASGKYTYKGFVDLVITESLNDVKLRPTPFVLKLTYLRTRLADRFSWALIAVWKRSFWMVVKLPVPVQLFIRRLRTWCCD